jgi:excisionase family DNA binding protein
MSSRTTETTRSTPERRPRKRDDEILTSREARELLKIGRTKLWELTRENVIPAYRIGGGKTSSLRYRRSELLAFLDQNRI